MMKEVTFNAIQRNPNHYQVVYTGFKRALTIRFPFGVVL